MEIIAGMIFLAVLGAITAFGLESEWMNEHKDEFELKDEELDELK